METEAHWSQEMVWPVLLAEARLAYTTEIRAAFEAAGFDDMPRAGARVIGRIAVGGTNVNEVAAVYGTSKQAASQLVDALVARGYVERMPDETDRRKMLVRLTERGTAAAEELRDAIARVDAGLSDAFDEDEINRAKLVVGTLVENHYRSREEAGEA